MKNILILSCRAGEGHNTAAKALLERVEHEGHRGRIVDFLGLSGEKLSNSFNDSYVSVAKHVPKFFGAIYNAGLFVSSHMHFFRSPLYGFALVPAKKLLALLQSEHFDAIIATHPIPAIALSHLRKKGHNVPLSIAVATDYTCYPFWEEAKGCDYFVLAHEDMAEEYIKRGIPAEKLRPCGIPIGMRFLNLPQRIEAKKALGLDPQKKLHLIMGGSMGAGHLRSFSEKLYKQIGDDELFVICGKNDRLRKKLKKHLANAKNAHIVGFTTDVPLYMAACDVLYTKPGGLTSTEALVCHTPTVHTAPIPGCESANFRFFGKKGISLPAKRSKEQLRLGLLLAASEEEQQKMYQAQLACAKPLASLHILQLTDEVPAAKQEPQASATQP